MGDLPEEAVAALSQGKKIEAIKIVRERRGLDLKSAKGAVEAYVGSRPELQVRLDAASSRNAWWFWLVVLIAALVVYFVVRRGS